MENIINLEQLDFRDRLIKEYIDEHGGGGVLDFMNITVAVSRPLDDSDMQHVYVGLPEGTSTNNLSIKFLRHSRVKEKNKKLLYYKGRYNGYHEIWAIPQKNKIPLINIIFKDKTHIDYTKAGFDFYELTGQVGDTIYDNFLDYVNIDYDTGYRDSDDQIISYGKLFSHKKGGICIMRDGKKISNVALIRTNYSEVFGEFRLTTTQ